MITNTFVISIKLPIVLKADLKIFHKTMKILKMKKFYSEEEY